MATQEEMAADKEAVDAYREHYGDAAAALFAAEVYKMRLTPQPHTPGTFYGFPRFAIVLIALWLALLETADKLPKLFLAFPAYEATLAEMHAKMMQPDITAAQLDKARSEARAAKWQPSLIAAQSYAAQMQWLQGVPTADWKRDGNRSIGDARPGKRHYFDDDPPTPAPSPAFTPVERSSPEPTPSYTPIATSSPDPAPTPLRTPTLFNCARAYNAVDFVICSDPHLLDAEARLEDVYQAARAARGGAVITEQKDWIRRYTADCNLTSQGRPAPDIIEGTASCVGGALERRIRELQREQ
jgi:uncharacterized protein YecT (DUF1311 family)